MGIKILLLILLCHIVDDFVLQPICLSKLKQMSWWQKEGFWNDIYKNDYKMALFIHSLSWSIMIHLPIIFLCYTYSWLLLLSVIINLIIHYIVDDLKANKYKINLITDQIIHFIQIIITFIILVIL